MPALRPWTAAAVLLALSQTLSFYFYRPILPPFTRPVLEEFAVMDMAEVLSGARRLGGDLAFIQMLQYYASHDSDGEESHDGHSHPDFNHAKPGDYPLLMRHALRTASLDPYFHYAYLFGAGALAFNLNRNQEAVDLLKEGARQDPTFWRFRLYAGAIAFRKSDQVDKVVELLSEAAQDPDCPSMVKNILAGIYKKQGRYLDAAKVYLDILDTSRDDAYRDTALHKLKEMQEKGLIPR